MNTISPLEATQRTSGIYRLQQGANRKSHVVMARVAHGPLDGQDGVRVRT